ncbi:hypothetical protein HN51_041205, partial [Arachis hypogaea]
MESLPEWLSTPSSLKSLQITNCPNLKSLPSNLHRPAIKSFQISDYPRLQKIFDNKEWLIRSEDMNVVLRLKTIILFYMDPLPHFLQQYASTLQNLVIGWCYKLVVLSKWLSNLSALKFLYIFDCSKLMSLPSDIHRLTSLQVLRIISCAELYKKYGPQ